MQSKQILNKKSHNLWERDIENAYWELDEGEVLDVVCKASELVITHRHVRGSFCFSIAERDQQMLDTMGTREI